MSMSRLLPSTLPLLLAIMANSLLGLCPVESAYLKSRCGFQSTNYTIKWAYEPQTQNVVFVLKAKLPHNGDGLKAGTEPMGKQLLTGIAFGTESQLDFIGILSINDQLDLVSGHGTGTTASGGTDKENANGHKTPRAGMVFKVSPVGNGKGEPGGSLGPIRSISLKRREADGSVIAEFARPLNGQGHKMADLSGCTTFFLVTQWVAYEPSTERNELPMEATVRRNVCALAEKCNLDVRNIQGQPQAGKEEGSTASAPNLPDEIVPAHANAPHRDEEAVPGEGDAGNLAQNRQEKPEVAQSVDVSGKGDPCAFQGSQYSVQWSYDRATQRVDFVMRHPPKMGQWWSAVGIGDNMSDMDIGLIFLADGEPKEMADYFSSSYDVPSKDGQQDWELDRSGSKWDGNEVEVHFSRKLVTKDVEKDRSLDGCVLFQFAANSGSYGPGNRIHKHEDWPDLYKACDLKKRCIRQKRESSDEDEHLPVVSHSTDEKKGQVAHSQNEDGPQQGQGQERAGQNSGGDKDEDKDRVISLLMKSLGPQIVNTVSESDAATANSTAAGNTVVGGPSGSEGKEMPAPSGSATVFPIIGEGEGEEGNYSRREGGAEAERGTNRGSAEEVPEEVAGRQKAGPKPVGLKRQEQPEGAGGSAETGSTAVTAAAAGGAPAEATIPGNASERTYSSVAPTRPEAANLPAVTNSTGSPFSLNAFLGGDGNPPSSSGNLVPVGEPGPAQAVAQPAPEAASTAIIRVSGEATSAENGADLLASSTVANSGFGINQMFGSGGGDQGVESTAGSYQNQTTQQAPISSSPAPALNGIAGQTGQGIVPVGESVPTTSGEASQEGHPAEEKPPPETYSNNTTPTPAPEASSASAFATIPSSTNGGLSIEELGGVGISSGSTPSNYAGPEASRTTASASDSAATSATEAANSPSVSTGDEFELIASGGEPNATSTAIPESSSSASPISGAPAEPTTLPATSPTAASKASATAPSASSSSSPVGSREEGKEEDEIYSTPAPQEPEASSVAPVVSPQAQSVTATSDGTTGRNRIQIDGEGASSGEDNGNAELPNNSVGTNATGGLTLENGSEGNALETATPTPAGAGTVRPGSSAGSSELEERGIRLPVATSKCDALRPDLPICQSYMDAYLERVKDWAERHGEPMQNQYPKACKLLSAVPHVPTLCCQIFADKCTDYV